MEKAFSEELAHHIEQVRCYRGHKIQYHFRKPQVEYFKQLASHQKTNTVNTSCFNSLADLQDLLGALSWGALIYG